MIVNQSNDRGTFTYRSSVTTHLSAHEEKSCPPARSQLSARKDFHVSADKSQECAELRKRLEAAATVIATLHHENMALRAQLDRQGTVVPIARPRLPDLRGVS